MALDPSTSGNVRILLFKDTLKAKRVAHRPLGPAIEGIKTYQGTLVHTANWSPNIDWKGKRVAVIGSGSSSIQVVPQLAEGKISDDGDTRSPSEPHLTDTRGS